MRTYTKEELLKNKSELIIFISTHPNISKEATEMIEFKIDILDALFNQVPPASQSHLV